MAEKKNIREEAAAAAENIRLEDREEIFIDRAAANEEPNLFVSVNGYNCLLPKGKTSKVPLAVYNEIMRSRRAEEKQDETINELKDAAAQPK